MADLLRWPCRQTVGRVALTVHAVALVFHREPTHRMLAPSDKIPTVQLYLRPVCFSFTDGG